MFLPEDLKNLLQYISPAAFKLISFREVAMRLLKMVRNKSQETQNRVMDAATRLVPDGIIFADEAFKCVKSKNLTVEENQRIGHGILKIYFAQLFNPEGVFLDLRLSNFEIDSGTVKWNASSFIHQFDPEFRFGILKLYQGFYGKKDHLIREGFSDLGLLSSGDSDADQKQLIKLLFSHFSSADSKPMQFKIKDFYDSFHQLFVFLKGKKQKIHSDFAFLGIYLVTLYLALEELGGEYHVAKCWDKAFDLGIPKRE